MFRVSTEDRQNMKEASWEVRSEKDVTKVGTSLMSNHLRCSRKVWIRIFAITSNSKLKTHHHPTRDHKLIVQTSTNCLIDPALNIIFTSPPYILDPPFIVCCISWAQADIYVYISTTNLHPICFPGKVHLRFSLLWGLCLGWLNLGVIRIYIKYYRVSLLFNIIICVVLLYCLYVAWFVLYIYNPFVVHINVNL